MMNARLLRQGRDMTAFRFLSSVLFLATFLLQPLHTRAAEEGKVISPDREIKTLLNNTYLVSTENGKISLRMIPFGKEEEWAKKIEGGGYGLPCRNNLARLNREGAAAHVAGTSHVVAFLDCPAANDGVAEYVVGLFKQATAAEPVCFAVVNQKNTGMDFSGYMTAVNFRKLSNGGYYGALTWNSGDAGFWKKSVAVVHLTERCVLTALRQFHTAGGPEELPGCREGYKGGDIEHLFVNSTNIEIIESKLLICDSKRTKEISNATRMNVDQLLKSRNR